MRPENVPDELGASLARLLPPLSFRDAMRTYNNVSLGE